MLSVALYACESRVQVFPLSRDLQRYRFDPHTYITPSMYQISSSAAGALLFGETQVNDHLPVGIPFSSDSRRRNAPSAPTMYTASLFTDFAPIQPANPGPGFQIYCQVCP